MDITERKKQLKAELEALDKVEAILNDPIAKRLLQDSLGQTAPPTAPEAPAVGARPQRRLIRIGARRAVILALHTGSCKFEDLARTLLWAHAELRAVLQPMVAHGLVYRVETTGVHGLTEKGKEHAAYYLSNPKAKVFGKYLPASLQRDAPVQ